MFKVLHKSPDIPESLSSEGQDFLQQCFRRNPAERPSAAVLLTHAFVQNLHDQDVQVHSQGQNCPRGDPGPGVSANYILNSLVMDHCQFVMVQGDQSL